jgi:hypothetical protein
VRRLEAARSPQLHRVRIVRNALKANAAAVVHAVVAVVVAVILVRQVPDRKAPA